MADVDSTMLDQQDHYEEIRAIRRALLIGLDSFGEIERITDEAEKLDMIGQPAPPTMKPIHPTGTNGTVGEFVTALRFLEIMETRNRA